jgi:1,4-dihydroxy-2-naphthoate octaprenyltransferase
MGIGMAVAGGVAHVGAALAALVGALLLQIGTNFANDYFDFVKGTDTEDRLGPERMTQQGHISPSAMRRAFIATFALALLVGIYLVARGGWPIVVIGLSGIAAGILYTGGPRPLGYSGWGDLLVLVYFGPVAVAGTVYVQSGRWSSDALVAGLAPGFLGAALLAVNNLRDTETDRATGKRTLAVRFGRRFAKAEYALCVAVAVAVPLAQWLSGRGPALALLATTTCATAIPALRAVIAARTGDRLLAPLAATGRLLAMYGIAFLVGWVLGE